MGRERGYEDVRTSLTFPPQVGKPSIKINFCVIRKMEHNSFLFPIRLKKKNKKTNIRTPGVQETHPFSECEEIFH